MSVDNNNKTNNIFLIKNLNPQDSDFIIKIYNLLNHIKTLDSRDKAVYKEYLSKYFNEFDKEIFKQFPLTKNTDISLLDNEYIVLEYKIEIEKGFSSYNIMRYALIGLDNTQNCLFINIMDNKVFSRSQLNFLTHINEIENINEYLESVKEDNIRVQGDLVFRIKLYDKEVEKDLENTIYEFLATEYNRFLANEIVQKLTNYLNNIRLSTDNIRVVNVFPSEIYLRLTLDISRVRHIDKYKCAFTRLICKLLQKIKESNDLINDCSVKDNAYNFTTLTELSIDIEITLNREKLKEILKVKEILNDLLSNPGEYTIVYGNHTIKYYGLPNTFNVSLSIDNRILTTTITFSTFRLNPMIIAYPGDILVQHNEHGEIMLKLKHKVSITLDNTNVSNRDTLIRNRISLKRFL